MGSLEFPESGTGKLGALSRGTWSAPPIPPHAGRVTQYSHRGGCPSPKDVQAPRPFLTSKVPSPQCQHPTLLLCPALPAWFQA